MLGQLREQIEHIGAEILHAILQAVERCIVPRGRERIFRYIHRQDGCRACRCTVEPESPGVREAVEHMLALCELRRCAAVILLIEEEPGFLSMDIIHVVQDAVFPDRHVSVQIRPKTVERHKACPLLHAFFLPELDIIALVDRVDLRTVCVQRLQQEREQLLLSQLHAQREHLRDQDRAEAIDRQPRETVRLAENQAAVVEILPHDRAAVIDRVPNTPRPECLVKAIIRVAREHAHADLGRAVIKPGAEPVAAARGHIHDLPVDAGSVCLQHFVCIDPRVAAAQAARCLVRDLNFRIISFHGIVTPNVIALLYPEHAARTRAKCDIYIFRPVVYNINISLF